jgi:membrane carboxypeptidase/penicillin-binding protein
MITDMLSDVTTRGTASRAKASFTHVAIAGKTGTSRDGWFVGYTPNLVCAVWIGYDDNQQLGFTGAESALPAWIDFVKEAIAIRPSLGGTTFPKPAGISTVKVDPETGYLAGPDCPSSEVVSVAWEFSPSMECYKHRKLEEGLMLAENTGEQSLTAESSPGSEAAAPAVSADEIGPAYPETENDSDIADTASPGKRANSRPTNKEINPGGVPALVNDPRLTQESMSAVPGAKHRR